MRPFLLELCLLAGTVFLLAACQTMQPARQPDQAEGVSAEQVAPGRDPYELQRWQYEETKKLMPY